MTAFSPQAFSIVSGLYETSVFTYYQNRNADTGEPENPVDLTGYGALMIWRRAPGETALVTLTDSSGLTIGDAAGTVTWVIDTVPSSMSGHEGVWSLELTDLSTNESELLRGRWVCEERVGA